MKAKKKRTRLWTILLVLVMVVGMLPTTALAADPAAPELSGSTIYANGYPILIEAGETSGTTVKYDSDKKTPYDYETVLTENNGEALTVFAGGNEKSIDTASVLMTGGNVDNLYGGGYAYGDGTSVKSVEITINGGNVSTIYGGGYSRYESGGYGGSSSVDAATITVNGGAVGTLYASSSYAGRACSNTVSSTSISVTGGTVVDIRENAGASTGNEPGSNAVTVTNFVITGGSIVSSNISLTPTNGETTPQNVSKKEITFKDKDEAKIVPNEPLSDLTTDAGYTYGMTDVKTDANGKIYVWLPDGASVSGARSASGDEYETGSAPGVLKQKATYTVSFDANGGSDVSSITNVAYGTKVTKPEDPTKTGYTFDGWYKEEGLTTAWNFEEDTVTEATTLYAKWTANTYTVTFDANGHGTAPTAQSGIAYGGTVSKPETDPIAVGYTFGGWYKEAGCTTAWNFETDTVTADTMLYAKWTANTYTVTFDANDGSGTTADVTNVSGTYTLPANGFTAPTGKQFKGWATSANGTVITGSTINVSANTTLYAIWEDIPATEHPITVTDGTASVSQAAAGTTVTLTANAAPSGKVFDKWVVVSGSITLADANSVATTFAMPAGAVSVKATYKSAPTIGGYIPPVQKPIVKNDDNVTTSADLSNTTSTSNGTTTANVDKAIGEEIVDKAVANESKEIVIDANAKNTTAAASTVIAQISIPTDTLESIAEKTEADVIVKNDVAEIKLNNAAAGAVAEQAAGDTVQIIVEKVDEKKNKVEFQLKVVCSAGKDISDFQGGNVAVTVAIPKEMEEKKVVCVYIDDNGKMTKVKGQKNEDGTYTFTTGHFSTYALMPEEEADAAIAAQNDEILAKLDSYELVARSAAGKTSGGKKAIKIRVYDKNGLSTDFFDGIEVYRSTKRNSGYGKKPIFVIKSGKSSYYNTAIKKGKTYYYKLRGYVKINGQKYCTSFSNKVYRTVK